MKPISSIRSASSSTKCSTLARLVWLSCRCSNKRPGVATKTSTPCLSCLVCVSILTPPYTLTTLSSMNWLYALMLSVTCAASSRVGTKISARTLPEWMSFGVSAICCKIGKANAAVLPVPVCAFARISLPRPAAGIACCCTGVIWS